MTDNRIERIASKIRNVPDFPKPGIQFKDITSLLCDGPIFRETIDLMAEKCANLGITKVVGIDARGFIFGSAIAYKLGVGFVVVRKLGKLPFTTDSVSYALEYGEATVEMHTDSIQQGEKVALADDLLATGGTAAAALELVRRSGGEVVTGERKKAAMAQPAAGLPQKTGFSRESPPIRCRPGCRGP
jgi:adenine phosphoribosyltransferase